MNGTAGPSEAELEQLMAQEEELRSRIALVERQLELVANARTDKERARQTLKGVESAEPGAELLFPIGGTTFVRAKLADNAEVIKGIGADYAMPRAVGKAIEELKAEIGALDNDMQGLSANARQLESRHQQIVQVLQAASGRPMPGAQPQA